MSNNQAWYYIVTPVKLRQRNVVWECGFVFLNEWSWDHIHKESVLFFIILTKKLHKSKQKKSLNLSKVSITKSTSLRNFLVFFFKIIKKKIVK